MMRLKVLKYIAFQRLFSETDHCTYLNFKRNLSCESLRRWKIECDQSKTRQADAKLPVVVHEYMFTEGSDKALE